MMELIPNKASLIEISHFVDGRGHLAFIEGEGRDIPFSIKRVYYIYNVPESSERGAHCHKNLEQLILPLSGGFHVHLDDGAEKCSIYLDNSCKGLYLKGLLWREIRDFTEHAVCLVLCSDHYDENDYIRDYKEFNSLTKCQK